MNATSLRKLKAVITIVPVRLGIASLNATVSLAKVLPYAANTLLQRSNFLIIVRLVRVLLVKAGQLRSSADVNAVTSLTSQPRGYGSNLQSLGFL
jgi:hypothetical protein